MAKDTVHLDGCRQMGLSEMFDDHIDDEDMVTLDGFSQMGLSEMFDDNIGDDFDISVRE